MSFRYLKLRIRNFNAFFIVIGLIALWLGCSPVDGKYEEPEDRRRRGADVPRDLSKNFEFGEEDDENGDSGYFLNKQRDDKKESAIETLHVTPRSQKRGLSKKIDFLFFVDASKKTQPFLDFENINSKFNSFIQQLENNDIAWRFYFISAAANKSDNPLNNGKPFFLERDGALIRTNFLSPTNLEPYDMQGSIHSVFVDTLSYNSVSGGKKARCDLPPYCHIENEIRPLRSFFRFLSSYANILREDADLVSIIISAGDEKRFGRSKEPLDSVSVMESFNEKFSKDKNFFSISIVVKVGEEGECVNSKLRAASRIPQLSLLTQGTVINICSTQQDGYGKPIVEFLKKKQQ